MVLSYAGVGSRRTPDHILALMRRIGVGLARWGWTLRSGGAGGADQAFEAGCRDADGAAEIFVPWPDFNGRTYCDEGPVSVMTTVDDDALVMAAEHHPAWARCSDAARKLHARNCYQVMGWRLDSPVACVICWTPRGEGGGGTGQALRIAQANGIPVFDLALPGALESLRKFVKEVR